MQLSSELIAVDVSKEILFVKMRAGWYWAAVQFISGVPLPPEKFRGPHPGYREARVEAWRKEAEGQVKTSYIQEVGYAWDRWCEKFSQVGREFKEKGSECGQISSD